jgi:hypothetical protein
VTVAANEESPPGLEEYLSLLIGLRVIRVREVPPPANLENPQQQFWIEIKQEGKDPLRLVCEPPPAGTHEARSVNPVQLIPFAIDKSTFENLFGDLSRLRAPKEEPAPPLSGEQNAQ